MNTRIRATGILGLMAVALAITASKPDAPRSSVYHPQSSGRDLVQQMEQQAPANSGLIERFVREGRFFTFREDGATPRQTTAADLAVLAVFWVVLVLLMIALVREDDGTLK